MCESTMNSPEILQAINKMDVTLLLCIVNLTCKCSEQVQHGTSLHLQYPHYQLTPGLQVTGGGSLEVAGGIQITSGSGAPLQTAQILNTQLQSVSGTAFASQLLLQTPRLGELRYVHVSLVFKNSVHL